MSEFEHGTQSPWGYIYDAQALPDLITAAEFSNFTNSKFPATDTRIAASIPSVSSSIRNYCGWHISPSLECGVLFNMRDLRDAFIGPDLLIQLPATFVTAVSKAVLDAKWNEDADDWDGEIITDADRFDLDTSNGLLKIYDAGARDRKSKLFVRYTAGYAITAIPLIKELAANRVTRALTDTYGVNSETAGGVSISYNASWSGKGSAALTDDTREILEAYRVKGVF